MSLAEVSPEVESLSRLDKIRLIQLLAQQLERDPADMIEPSRSYPLQSPDQAFTAAAALLQSLDQDRTFILEKEWAAYEAAKPSLLPQELGKLVLIRDGQVVDTFVAELDAVKAGYEKFGNVPFLVHKVTEVECPHNILSDLLAI